uniref:Uncharacterized protein n=1 Tax=Romanomermis culicivorax TaxID=13658 RepID=A0A915L921_ROMCU
MAELLFMMVNSWKSFPLATCGAASCWHPLPVYVVITVFHLVVSTMIIVTNAYLLIKVIKTTKDLGASSSKTKIALRRNFSTNVSSSGSRRPRPTTTETSSPPPGQEWEP